VLSDNIEEGVGAAQRDKVDRAGQFLKEKKYREAEALLKEVLDFFDKQMSDPRATYVCLANRDELKKYQKDNPGKEKVVWLDWSFGTALHHQAFLLVAQKKWPPALKVLDREVALRPFAAHPHAERGYVLNALKKPKEGLQAYRKALNLSERYASSRSMKAVALRGIGFSLIDLKDLPGARKAYEASLTVDPNNRTALAELAFIRDLAAKQKK
jgi:tetratricopeptide (TPR) repeat protein